MQTRTPDASLSVFLQAYFDEDSFDPASEKIIYFRFASHRELVPECPEVKRINVALSHRFETFTVEIHNMIEQEGKPDC